MLHHGLPPAKGTLRLLPHPVANTRPAKDVAALRRSRILQLLKTKRALALLRALDETHNRVIGKVVPRTAEHRGLRRRLDVKLRGIPPRRSGRIQELVVGRKGVVVERHVYLRRVVVRIAFALLFRGRVGGGAGQDGADVKVRLRSELHDKQGAEDLVARAIGGIGDLVGEDVSQAEQPLHNLVVRAREVEHGQRQRIYGRSRRDGREMRQDIPPDPRLPALRFPLVGEPLDAGLKRRAYFTPQFWEDLGRDVRSQHGAEDVSRPARQGRQRRRFGASVDLDDVRVLFAEGAVPQQSCEGEVEEGGGEAGFVRPGVGGTGAEKRPVERGEAVGEVAGEVGVFLVGADYVGSAGVGEGASWGEARRGELRA